jgi:class III poly(R)-hydroxyalkanoic acid synthase PhaE subunit
MNWTSQAEEMTKVWADAQQQMWAQWMTLSNNGPSADFFDQWQKMTSTNVENWMATAGDTSKETADRILASQQAMVRFWEFTARSWQDILTKMESGSDWQKALQETITNMREQYTQAAETIYKTNSSSEDLWQIYQQQMQPLLKPWAEWWQQAPFTLGQAMMSGDNTVLPEWGKLYHTIYEQTISPFLKSPTMGLNRQLEHKLRHGFVVWQEYREADFNYQMLTIDAWLKTFEYAQEELRLLSERGETITSLEALGTVWINAGERGFGEVFASQEYIEAQGSLVNATMRFRIYRREVIELISQEYDIPTRSEVDAAHKKNYQLRKELKAIKKELASATAQVAENGYKEDIAALKKELKTLRQAVNKQAATEMQTELAALKAELDALKQTTGDAAAPAPKKRASTRRRTTKKTQEQEEASRTSDKGES